MTPTVPLSFAMNTSGPQLALPQAKPGPYLTQLAPLDEMRFRQWIQQKQVPWQDSPTSDYDMRGYYQALQKGDARAVETQSAFDGKMHFPDTWKTPNHKTFSNESMYALPTAPTWRGDRLVNAMGGIVADETPKKKK
jgi:hypothetical protein